MDKILRIWMQMYCHGNCNIWSVPYAEPETGLQAIRDNEMMDELRSLGT